MRNFLIWTLSILLGFEPALMAKGQANRQSEIKAFLEKSELGKKSQSLVEMYHKVSADIPAQEALKLNDFMVFSKGHKLPKFDIRKMTSSDGKVYYQLQGVQNGQSVTAEIYTEGSHFMRINGKVFTAQDMRSPQKVFAKLGIPAADIKKIYPSKAQANGFLSAEQILKLPRKKQAQYFKNFRQLLESMEAVQNAKTPRKTASNELMGPRFEIIAKWLQGEPAYAAFNAGDSCIAGGHIANVVYNKKRKVNNKIVPGLSCGSDGNGGIVAQYSTLPNGTRCAYGEFSCNSLIYGDGGGCIPAGRETTKACNLTIKGNDIPDRFQNNKEEFNRYKDKALMVAEAISSQVCSQLDSSSPSANDLVADQKETCRNFQDRYETMKKWTCDNPEFKNSYKKLCEEPAPPAPAEPPPVAAPPEVVTPAPTAPPAAPAEPAAPPKDERLRCENLPVNESTQSDCNNGNVLRKTTGDVRCLDGETLRDIYVCSCDEGPVQPGFKCLQSQDDSGSGKLKSKKPKKKDKGPNWWLIGGVAFAGLLVFHWLNKRSAKIQYGYLEPEEQKPPVETPVTPAPTPRGVQ